MSSIDVTKCAFYYDNGKCNNPNGMACNCANVAECYFKQLQIYKNKFKKIKEVVNKYDTNEIYKVSASPFVNSLEDCCDILQIIKEKE